jgi:hypothetical protein
MALDFEISDVDSAPEDLPDQTPFTATLLRRMPGKDRPDYWLARLTKPLRWEQPTGPPRPVTHLIISSRYEGTTVTEEMNGLVVGIAYVTDDSLLEDESLDFEKCRYVAIGTASTIHGV